MVNVGDSIKMGCVFQSTEEKRMTKVDWMFSSGKHAKVMKRKPLADGVRTVGERENLGTRCHAVALQVLGSGSCQNWAFS